MDRQCILVVEDDEPLLAAIQNILEGEGYAVLTATDGVEALQVMEETQPDLILADVAMPGINGYQLYERVRRNPQWVLIPFMFLTGRAMDSDIRYGKEMGVDDYLTKPVEPEDMLSAIRGKLRRVQQLVEQSAHLVPPSALGPRALVVGKLRIDPGQHRVWLNGEPVKLSATEFTLLEYLARRMDQVVSQRELVKVTHGLDTDHVEAGALVRPLIRCLRRKLGYPVGDMGCIENVRGVGYRLIPPDD
jgi:DNA-binding response OmpR family regulator